MNIYEFFDTEEERESYVAMESAELAHDRVMLALDLANKSEQLALREAEIKCIMESGDTLDLMEYYEDAEAAAGEKKQNLIQKAWQALKNLFQRIKDFFTGKNNQIPAEGQTEAPADLEKNHNKIKKFWADVKGFVAHPVQSVLDAKSGDWDELASGIGAIVAVSAATAGTVALVKYNNSKLKSIEDEENGILNEAGGFIGKFANSTVGQIAANLSTKAHDLIQTVINAVKNMLTTISNFVHGKKGNDDDGKQLPAVTNETKPANPDEKPVQTATTTEVGPASKETQRQYNSGKAKESDAEFKEKQQEGKAAIKQWMKDKRAGKFKTDEEAQAARQEVVNQYKKYGIESVDDLDIPGDLFEEDTDPFGFADIFNLDEYTESATDEELEEILAFF